ncbi:MAG: hemolysin XhlA family protein [Candidatus Pacebacteria bacterium]|nr:hemolysin XhlA family protein [Candidatus Paceibacterota bacterium]
MKTLTVRQGVGLLLTLMITLTFVWGAQAQGPDEGKHYPGPLQGDARGPGHRRGVGHRELDRVQEFVADLKEQNPEEYERLMDLRREHPEQFRNELRERIHQRMKRRLGAMMTAEDKECIELSRKYHQAETDAERRAFREQLRKAVRTAFDARLQRHKEMIEKLEDRVNELKQRMSEREDKRDEICEQRLERLTADPELAW